MKYDKKNFFALVTMCSLVEVVQASPTTIAIGIASVNAGVISISTTKDTLRDKSVLICIGVSDKSGRCSSFLGRDFKMATTNDSVNDVALGKEIHTFKYPMNEGEEANNSYGIAVIYPLKKEVNYKFTLKNASSELSFLSKNEILNVNLCTSAEGVHVYSLQYKDSMHLYLSLGYEVIPTCPDKVCQ